MRFKHKRVEITGTVIKRSGTHVRVQPKDGGATLWKELSELLPLAPVVDEASEVAELQRLFSSGPPSARAHALSAPGVQAAANPTVAGTPNKFGMPTSKPKVAVGPLRAAPPEIKRELFEAVEQGHKAAPEDAKVAEPVPETTDSAPTENVEPAIGAATEAESAQAVASTETRNPIFKISNSMVNASAFTPRGPSSSGPSSSPDALSVGNMHRAILKADNSPRQPMTFRTSTDGCTLLPPKLHRALTELDAILIQVLLQGAIRLLRVEWLMKQLDHFRMPRRQVLEELEVSGVLPSPLLSPQEAAALVERGDRSIGALTYGWLSPGDPDPDGSRIRVLRRALMGMAIRIEALFWDFGSLYQAPRTPEQSASFKLALEGGAMNQLYASILATTVLQIEEIPPRPAEFDGMVCLFKLSANVDENKVRAALKRFGTVKSCDLSRSPPIVRFASHLSAVKAKEAGAWPGLCEGLDTLYNETPYFSRGW